MILCRDSLGLNYQSLIPLAVSAVLGCRSRSDLDIWTSEDLDSLRLGTVLIDLVDLYSNYIQTSTFVTIGIRLASVSVSLFVLLSC